MNTPIYDFVSRYIAADNSRLHMPGHKGINRLGIEQRDITEVHGADVLYEAEGIIAESEANAAALFGTGRTVYSTEGSSHVIKAMLYLALLKAKRDGLSGRPLVLAARNVHKAFIYACALLDLDVEWVYPESENINSICACHPTAEQIGSALKKLAADGRTPIAVYITSPDYLGTVADIRAIADICGDTPLLVDNAHGAYLHFIEPPMHPIDLGAFMCSDSAHKTLPVLTGGAYLQMNKQANDELGIEANAALALFGSTSPSYVIMQSLDLANAYMDSAYRSKLRGLTAALNALKKELSDAGIVFAESEPLKLVIDAAALGTTGSALYELFRSNQIESEFADVNYLVLMLTPDNTHRDLERVRNVLLSLQKNSSMQIQSHPVRLTPLTQKISIREAVMSAHEIIDVSESEGRICGQPSVSCPPAILIAVSGELIDAETIEIFKAYGVEKISVVI